MTHPRPRLHHTPASGWVNDPLGMSFYDGSYHLFFQYVPGRTTWDVGCHWGHATSPDLLTWSAEPVALAPGDGEDGVWSGSLARPDTGPAVVFYTAVAAPDREIGWVRRAVPTDDRWGAWTKEDVVVRLPDGEPAVAFRDPFVYRDASGKGWRMLVGGGLEGGIPVVWMFTSADLHEWAYAGRAAVGDGSTGTVWECPSLLRVDGRAVLVVAVGDLGVPGHAAYAWVNEDGDRLVPGSWRRLSYGPSYYAGSAFADADGRPGLIHWLREVADEGAGWAGAHSLAHLLRREDDLLVAGPHPGLDDRRAPALADGAALPGLADVVWTPAEEDALVLRAVDGPGLSLRVTGGELVVETAGWVASMPSSGSLRVVLDGPILEVFGDQSVLAGPLPPAESYRCEPARGPVCAYPLS